METLRYKVVCSLWISSSLQKLRVEKAHFKNYSSFIIYRGCTTLFLVGSINKKDVCLYSLEEEPSVRRSKYIIKETLTISDNSNDFQ